MLSSDGKYINQVDSGILRCRKSYFSLNNVGMPYPGLPVDLKQCILSSNRCRVQFVKAFLGLSKYSHHSKLMTALGILPIEESIKSRPMFVSLMKRLFLVNYPVGLRSLCSFLCLNIY